MAITFAVYVVEGKWKQNFKIAFAVILVDLVAAFTAMLISIGMLGPHNTFTLVPPEHKTNITV